MAIPLVLDNTKLQALRACAEADRIPIDEMREIAAGRAPRAGDRPGHTCGLPVGWAVSFSIEEHPRKDGTGTVWLRHMSMSQEAPGRDPNPAAIAEVCKLLGFPDLDGDGCVIQRNPVDGVLEVLAELRGG